MPRNSVSWPPIPYSPHYPLAKRLRASLLAAKTGIMAGKVQAACHCGGVSLSVTPRSSEDGTADITFCHCESCRHATGALLVSYLAVEGVADSDLNGTKEYATSDGWARRFCSTCGCHVLRSRDTDGGREWEVSTGILAGSAGSDGDDPLPKVRFTSHAEVASTQDGGGSVWLTEVDGHKMETLPERPSGDHNPAEPPFHFPEGSLPASCDCGTVAFHITRPDESSRLPHSYLPDLTHAYCSTDPSIIANPTDKKWWLRPGEKYLAGTCACRTCRLTSGFEIQAWAFVPRSNIHFHILAEGETAVMPLDFATLPEGVLKSYASSPDVLREFCGGCGATVFWRGRLRPELVDVSVGLLRGDGARAGAWLEWWTGRVSFSEEAGRGRGGEAMRAWALVSALEGGLKEWSQGY